MAQLLIFRCAWCGEHLADPNSERQARSDKKFCNASCRGKYHRWHRHLETECNRASKAIKHMAEYLQHPMAQQEAAAKLIQLRELIKSEAAANGMVGVR